MNGSAYIIERSPGRGWLVTCRGKVVGKSPNVVGAIDFANQLAERDSAFYQQEVRVILKDDEPAPTGHN